MPTRNWYTKEIGGYTGSGDEPYLINNVWAAHDAIRNYIPRITLAATCGIIGNMFAESGMNPARWQSDNVGNWSGGLGLIQWTPATAMSDYVTNAYDGNQQCELIAMELNNEPPVNGRWGSGTYPVDVETFLATTSPSDAAVIYLFNRERPQDPYATLAYRQDMADYAYQILTGSPPPDPGPQPDPPTPPGPGPGPTPVTTLKFIKKRQNYRRRH